jgi:hypothetical protein
MSERRALRAYLLDAALRAQEAAAFAQEAIDYMDTYPFLIADNPELQDQLKADCAALKMLGDRLWETRL